MQRSYRFRQRAIPIAIVAVCMLWAAAYVYHAAQDAQGGDESVLFLQPLFYLLLAAAIWAVIEAATSRADVDPTSGPETSNAGASGLGDRRRLAVVLSLPLMVMLAWLVGFVVSSAAYVALLSWGLGERRRTTLASMALAAAALVWILFATLLGVPLPLWPAWAM